MNEIILSAKFCQVEYDKENNWIYAIWSGYQSVDNIKIVMEAYLKTMEDKKCSAVITDLTRAKGTFTDANTWISNDWMPRALVAGYKYCAMVYSSDIFMKYAVNDLNRKYEKSGLSNFYLRHFGDMGEAVVWLQDKRRMAENN